MFKFNFNFVSPVARRTGDRGAIREGLLADLIAVPGNPLEDITVTEDVMFVMLGGWVVKHVVGGHDVHRISGRSGCS